MSDLNKTTGGVVNNYAIKPDQISNVYDVLTGDNAYGNIGFAKWQHLNAGGTFGDSGYGLRSSGGSIQCKNSGGAWTNIGSGVVSSGGSQYYVQINDGGSGHAGDAGLRFDTSTHNFRAGDLTNHDTAISMSESNGRLFCIGTGTVSMGDYHAITDGTYVSTNDTSEVQRFQAEGSVTIGDMDWAAYGNDTHIEVSDSNQQISMSCIGGWVISTLSTGGAIDVGADAKGKLQNAASDFRLKENIKPIENPLDKVLNLNGVNYQWKYKENDRKKYIGLIAQEVVHVLPEVVFQHDDNYGLNYKFLVPLLVEAVKERQNQIENLKERLNKFD